MSESIPSPERQISPEALAEKVSLLMTKPEKTDTPAPLLLLLKNRGLDAKAFRFIIDEERLKGLYPDMSTWKEVIQRATREDMVGKEVEVFLVKKDAENNSEEGVVEQLYKLKGPEFAPANNPEDTLRRELAEGAKKYMDETGAEFLYHYNGFHSPKNSAELMANLNVFGLLDEAIEFSK